MNLYEILVPTIHRANGKPIRTRFHRVWDEKVRAITGGLTITAPTRGQWICPKGELYAERVIPVRIMCTPEQIKQISALTARYYNQLAIMYYCVSNEVVVEHFPENS